MAALFGDVPQTGEEVVSVVPVNDGVPVGDAGTGGDYYLMYSEEPVVGVSCPPAVPPHS